MKTTENKLSINRRAQWAIGLILTILIIYLHITFMQSAGAFWRDEINSLQLAAMPSISGIWAKLQLDSFPLLSTLVLRLWSATGWGGNYMGLRFFGLLVGLGILGVIWLDARLIGNRIPLLSLALFGFTSLLVREGDAIRPYGLGIFLILLAFGLIWKVVERPTNRRIFAATLVSLLSVQCLYSNAFLLLSILLGGAVVTLRNSMFKRTILLIGIGFISALSLVPYIGKIQGAGQWAPLVQISTTYKMLWITLSRDWLGSANGYITLIWAILFSLGILIAIYKNITSSKTPKTEANRALFLATVMTVTTIEFFVLYKNMQVYPFSRYFLFPMSVVAVCINGLLGEKQPLWCLGRIALTILIVGLTFNATLHGVRMRQTSMDLVVAKLESSVSKNDMILVTPWFYGVSFQRYYSGDAPWMTIPPIKDLSIHRFDLIKEKMTSPDPIRSVFEGISKTLRSGGKVWFVGKVVINPYIRLEAPPILPPAPFGTYGWMSGPYLRSWEMQTVYFISSRALRYKQRFSVPSKFLSPYENPLVMEVWGWREE